MRKRSCSEHDKTVICVIIQARLILDAFQKLRNQKSHIEMKKSHTDSKLLDKNYAKSSISENSEVNRARVSQVYQALSEGEMR